MNDIYKEVGSRIRAQRKLQELTLEDLAELSGLHASFIGQIERGSKKCSLQTVSTLAVALGVGVTRLFGAPLPKGARALFLDDAARANTPAERRVLLEVVRGLSRGLRGLRA